MYPKLLLYFEGIQAEQAIFMLYFNLVIISVTPFKINRFKTTSNSWWQGNHSYFPYYFWYFPQNISIRKKTILNFRDNPQKNKFSFFQGLIGMINSIFKKGIVSLHVNT